MSTLGRLGRAVTIASLGLFALGLSLATSAGAQAAPTLAVSPAKGLIDPVGDGQFVRLSWTGLPADLAPVLRQCSARPKTVHDCSQTGLSGPGLITAGNPTPDGSGSFVVAVQIGLVNATISGDPTKDSFTCDYRHPCTMALFLDENAVDVRGAVIVPITFAFPPSACPAPSGTPVGGVGASAVFRAMLQWESQACKGAYDLVVQYTLQSGLVGGQDFAAGSASFGAVADALPDLQQGILEGKGVPYAYAPVSASALVFGVRLYDRVTDRAITDIKLTPDQIVSLFTGQMTWNDPGILALNPQYLDANGEGTLPQIVKPVARGDASEDTLAFSRWAWRTSRDVWIHAGDGLPNVDHNPFEDGPTTLFPSVALGQPALLQGARSVAREVARPSQDADHINGFIGYMDSSWAASYGLATVKVQNPAGTFVAPTSHAIAAGVSHMQVDANGVTRTPSFTSTDAAAYPLPTLNYLLVHQSATDTFTAEQGTTLKAFLDYIVGKGQRALPPGYVPLAHDLVKLSTAAAGGIPTATPAGGTTGPPVTSPDVAPPSLHTPVLPTGTSSPSASAAPPSPVERGPYVPPGTLAASSTRSFLPFLFGSGLAGLVVGPSMTWEDRRRRRRPEKAAGAPPRRRRGARHAARRRRRRKGVE